MARGKLKPSFAIFLDPLISSRRKHALAQYHRSDPNGLVPLLAAFPDIRGTSPSVGQEFRAGLGEPEGKDKADQNRARPHDGGRISDLCRLIRGHGQHGG